MSGIQYLAANDGQQPTTGGLNIVRQIDLAVHAKVHQFQSELTEEGKFGALATFSFYLGLDSDPRLSLLLGGMAVHHHDHD